MIVGTGISGIAAVKLLMKENAKKIILFDGNEKALVNEIRKKLPESFAGDIVVGELPADLSDIDIAILSPGVPTDIPMVDTLRRNGIKIWGELELGYKTAKGELVAITGTNGKTTTTSLVGEIMKEQYESTFVVGNIGLPYTEYSHEMIDESITVAEVSSFQLETIEDFKPKVSAILNITPDHLNRHHTMENYIAAKFDITANQDENDICVLNYEDKLIREKASEVKAKIFYFSSATELEEGVFLRGEDIIYRENGEEINVCTIHDMKLLGMHNYENVMAAVAIAMHAGVPIDKIRHAIKEFNAVEHRIEFVREAYGVKYYNDSKGTNPDAAIKAVEAMITPVVLIGGGYDKKSEYDEWIMSFKDKVKALVLIGETADKIKETAFKYDFKNVYKVDSLEEAVAKSKELAESGWAVLLSPACASWDMFKSYEERGKLFKDYVNAL
ncbi:MAG: UDP-N-acetylmuramoyl-L-alanine--D-glutamate ligase [Lachnospiraceae bacterium]|nr:UDP-N-acetylmuramoyl-L-alanine--D-glutamate ligase [Lachnospiraceae bacterium]